MTITVTVWLHVTLLLHASEARHVRVALKVLPQSAFVVVLRTSTMVALHESVGVSRKETLQLMGRAYERLNNDRLAAECYAGRFPPP